MNLRSKIWLNILFWGMLLAGCDRFLDVKLKDQYTEEQLLATRGGYYTAVNGIYNRLASASLYGKNLSYELIDVIGQRYASLDKSVYLTSLNARAYGETSVAGALEDVWASAYGTVLNCNVILDNLESQKGILSSGEAGLMKGELLAVRAFLHFDMLRLFGPIYKENPSASSIPYNESVRIENLPLLSAEAVIRDKILRDLAAAEQLLREDPVVGGGPMASVPEDKTEEVYLRYRQLRMNYYAVLALQARVLLYAGEKEKALQAACKLLENPEVAKWFPPVDPNRLLANSVDPDRVFSTEVLFGLYARDRGDIYTYHFDAENAGNNFLQPRKSFVEGNLFAGETQDYRYQSQWAPSTTVGVNGYVLVKYKAVKDEEARLFYATFVPLIRLSELYYIAAECEANPEDGCKWLNRIRGMRGLPEISLADAPRLMDKIRMEYLREFLGEGQIFYLYKRLFADMPATENGHNNKKVPADASGYVPPMPAKEIENR